MPDFSAFDQKLLNLIGQRVSRFRDIADKLEKEASEYSIEGPAGKTPAWRVVDRRLQVLRKTGEVSFDRKTGWRLAP